MTDPRSTSAASPGAHDTSLPAAQAHPQVRHWLGQLDELVDHMDQEGWDGWARERARQLIDFFGTAGRQQRRDEETLLFPLVAGRGDAALGRQGRTPAAGPRLARGELGRAGLRAASHRRGVRHHRRRAAAPRGRGVRRLWLEHLDLVERVIHPAALAAHPSLESSAAARVARAGGLETADS